VADEVQEVPEKESVVLRGENGVEQKHDLPLSNGVRDMLINGHVSVVSDDPEEQERLTKELSRDPHEEVTRVQALGGALQTGKEVVTDDGKPVVIANANPTVDSDPSQVLASEEVELEEDEPEVKTTKRNRR
jgi:hypothetical protein